MTAPARMRTAEELRQDVATAVELSWDDTLVPRAAALKQADAAIEVCIQAAIDACEWQRDRLAGPQASAADFYRQQAAEWCASAIRGMKA